MGKLTIRDLVSIHLNDYVEPKFNLMITTDGKLTHLETRALLPFFAEDLNTDKAVVIRDKNSYRHDLTKFMLHPPVRPNNSLPDEVRHAIKTHVEIAAKFIVDEAVIPVYCDGYQMIFITSNEAYIEETEYRPIDLYREVFDQIFNTFVNRCNETEKETFRYLESTPKNPYTDMIKNKIQRGPSEDTAKAKVLPKNQPDTNTIKFSQVMQETDFDLLALDLKSKVIGHDQNIDEVIKVLKYRRLNLNSKNPPSFIFAGVSGTGKTQLGLELATSLGFNCVRLDMSEYREPHNVARIIGAPNGYIGHGEAGVLDECSNTFNVIIIDEMEKAHEDVMDIFLQALDYSTITNGKGKQIDFSKSIFIFTTNLGAKEATGNRIEIMKGSSSIDSDIKKSVNLALKTEFVNRFSKVLTFCSLTEDDMRRILDVVIKKYQVAIRENHHVNFTVDSKIKEYILHSTITTNMGVRPMERAVQNEVMEKISDAIWNLTKVEIIQTNLGMITVSPANEAHKKVMAA
ncbi:AAA family ATPase [Bdellovibrio sp. BCCA]|uniref:AAA family ATPase n=1 Tax=Bdellovibrio sp. BCCA TaxID=3136281 RepID=UPI0030F20E2C